MVEHQFADRRLAGVYDALHPRERRDDHAFYLPYVMAAGAVLDVGCGTGALLHRARELGHTGRLCGLDPGAGMLERARRRTDIEWVLGEAGAMPWQGEFDLVVMTGHAFQVFVDDTELAAALAAIHRALRPGGRLAFETRNPAARAWERWTPEHAVETTDPAGARVRYAHQVELPVEGDVVSFTTTYTSPDWDRPEVNRSTLRFLAAEPLAAALAEAGLVIEERYGDFSGAPLTAGSPEIIVIARR